MKQPTTKKTVLSGLFIALGLLLPFLTAQVPSLGNKFLPMHIPALLCGFVCGWQYGLVVGFIMPLFRSILFGMPPIIPIALSMAFELAAYGCVSGFLHKILPKKLSYILVSLIASMICGRIVWGIASIFLYGINGTQFTFELFLAGAFVNAIPGIIIQIVLIPAIIMLLLRAKLIDNE
jgi:riboflavin transporter FmnP